MKNFGLKLADPPHIVIHFFNRFHFHFLSANSVYPPPRLLKMLYSSKCSDILCTVPLNLATGYVEQN